MIVAAPPKACSGYRRTADPPATEDRHRVSKADFAGEHRGPETCHDPATEEAGHFRPCTVVNHGALAGRDEGLVCKSPDPERGESTVASARVIF